MAGTTSAGVALRPMGFSSAAACTMRSGVSFRKFVSIMLGATQLTVTPNLFWLDLKKIDFSPKAGIKKLSLTKGEIYAGDAVKDLKDSESLTFLFETPLM